MRRITQDHFRLSNEKDRLFNFNERVIFGRFDLMIRRVNKLMTIFTTIQQFRQFNEQQVGVGGRRCVCDRRYR